MFACMDTETTEWNNHNLHLELKFGYICYFSNNKRKNVLFENAKDMFSSIEYMRHTFKKPFLVFTHNMDYDFKFILNYMRERYSFKIIDNGLIFSIKVYRKTDSDNPKKKKYLVCEFRNSLRLIPLSLKKIGIALRLHKIERNQNVQDNLDMFHTYCIRDCNIIYKALKYLQKFFQKQDYPIEIEKISMSFPSIAYKIFHKNNSEFETIDEKCRHTNQLTNICNWINDYFRKYYYGGRCEVFVVFYV